MQADIRDKKIGLSFLTRTISKFADPLKPYYMTDGYEVYSKYLRMILGEEVKRVYKTKHWHTRKKSYAFKEGVNYGQVVKTRNGKKLEKVEMVQIAGEVPKAYFNTSAVERMNLTIRNGMARMKRISQTFSKDLDALQQSCMVFRVLYNFCRPHSGLGKGPYKATPAMKLGLTDHVWNVREMMSFSFRQNIRKLRVQDRTIFIFLILDIYERQSRSL